MGLENGCGRLIELRKRMSTYAIHFSYIYVKGPGNKKIWLDLINKVEKQWNISCQPCLM